MTRDFSELRAKIPAERRARSSAKAQKIVAEMRLAELRESFDLCQADLATALQVNQPAIAKLEHRSDMYLSTLRNYVEALGGKLLVYASFPSQVIALSPALGSTAQQEIKSRPTNKRAKLEVPKPSQKRKRKTQEPAMSICAVNRSSKLSVPVKSK